jgi:PH (Pleckstrin Homology) domain-containing protein/von Willebrand factor type A domain-containing protein
MHANYFRFGKLRLHCQIRVGKDRRAWQDLDCYLFSDMLICVKERKSAQNIPYEGSLSSPPSKPRCTLKGSILIKKHLKTVETSPGKKPFSMAFGSNCQHVIIMLTNMGADENLLTLTLSVTELPAFYLQFRNRAQMEQWRLALLEINNPNPNPHPRAPEFDLETSGTDDEDFKINPTQRLSSVNSSYGGAKSYNTAPTEYSNSRGMGGYQMWPGQSPHVPLDIVVVIPVSSSMKGLKITLLRDTLRFLVTHLGDRDRMGLVTFGSSGGGVPLVGMTSKAWPGWQKTLESIRPVGQKSMRTDVVDGANVAMDLLMQRKSANPLASILLISDSSTSDPESVDFVVQRAEAAK